MSATKIKQQLQREIKKNPQKAGALGLLMLVALWFWAPLVWSWLPVHKEAAATAAVATKTPDKATEDGPPPSAPRATWDQLADWMEQDELMAVATTLPTDRDPFAGLKETSPKEKAPPSKPVVVWTPEAAGLELSGTIVGARRRTAVIGGKAYLEGQTIAGDASGPITLVEVHAKRVVLEHDRQRFELKINSAARGQSLVAAP